MTMILPPLTITTAIASLTPGSVFQFRERGNGVRNLILQGKFAYGSGGTTVDAYVQTSFDGGASWVDIANFHFALASATFVYNLSSLTPVATEYTPTSGTLAANTSKDGLIGPLICVAYKSAGTYAGGTTLQIDAHSGDQIVSQA